jgi:hypothetical protein
MQRHRHDGIHAGPAPLREPARQQHAEDPADRDLPAVLEAVDQHVQRKFVAIGREGGIERSPSPEAVAAGFTGSGRGHRAANAGGDVLRKVGLAVPAKVERGRLPGVQAQQACSRKKPVQQ